MSPEDVRDKDVFPLNKVNGAAAVASFIGFVDRLSRTAGGGAGEDGPGKIVVVHNVVAYRDIRRTDHQNSFPLRILDGKSGDHHAAQTGMVVAIDQHAVALIGRVNGGLLRAGSEQGERATDDDALLVGAGCHVDHVVRVGSIDGG